MARGTKSFERLPAAVDGARRRRYGARTHGHAPVGRRFRGPRRHKQNIMIESIRLVNFKNFKDETLRLGPVTLLVGANASGKSNIRDAFRFLHGLAGSVYTRAYGVNEIIGGTSGAAGQPAWAPIRGANNEIVRFGQREFALEVTLGRAGNGARRELRYVVRVGREAGGAGVFTVLEEDIYEGAERVWRRPEASEPDRFLHGGMGPNRGNGHGRERACIEAVAESLLGIRFFDPDPERMKRPSFPTQRTLGSHGENLPSVLRRLCGDKSTKEALVSWVRELTPMDVRDIEFRDDPLGKTHLLLVDKNGSEVSTVSASEGTLRFLGVLTAMFEGKGKTLYFMEEIENGIHPSRQWLLLDLIERQAEAESIQAVATTHSSALLTSISDRSFDYASVVCRLEDRDDAIVRPLKDISNSGELRRTQGLGRLLEGAWMEITLSFMANRDSREGAPG